MRETTLQDYKERILKVLVHIQHNLDEDLALAELAEIAYFSPYHFHRVFRGMLGESVKGHIRRLRLERAAMKLKGSRTPVTQIAFQAGYETHEAFTRAFKAMSGLSPSQFRARNSPLSLAPSPSGVHFEKGGRPKDFNPVRYGGEKMDVKIKNIEPMRVAFMRHVGPYSECGATWERFVPKLGQQGILGAGATFLGYCHDDPEVTPPEKIRYDACVTVDESFVPEGEMGVQTIPGGDYAVVTHFGPYDKLGETYAKLCGEWLPQSGRVPRSAPCFEIYLNDPEGTDPEDLITDIHVPLEPK